MTPTEALQKHRQHCDELYTLTLEENRFLKEQRRPPEASLVARKRDLLERLTQSLDNIRAVGSGTVGDTARKEAIEKARERILQILHLDRENEQLLMRSSLSRVAKSSSQPTASPAQLQKLYERHG